MARKKSDIEQVGTGLALVEDPLGIKDLLLQPKEQLADHVTLRLRYTALDMADQGRYFHAIKTLCKHGDWEPFIQERKWSYEYVLYAMKLLEVSSWLPEILNVPPGGMTQRILRLPRPEIKELLSGLSPQEIENLTPWDLHRLHAKIPRARDKNKPQKPIPQKVLDKFQKIQEQRLDQRRVEFDHAFEAAVSALGKLASIEIDPSWYDDIFDDGQTQRLGTVYGRAIANLHPIEEIMKRETIVHAPGFGDPL